MGAEEVHDLQLLCRWEAIPWWPAPRVQAQMKSFSLSNVCYSFKHVYDQYRDCVLIVPYCFIVVFGLSINNIQTFSI